MKPSERIKEISTKLFNEDKLGARGLGIYGDLAIQEYLDEEKNRINEVLHEMVSMMHDGSASDIQTANYLHQMIDEKLKE